MKLAISIALGGSIGALSRYYISKLITNLFGVIFPVGTLAINIFGSLLIGFFYGLFEKKIIQEEIKVFITIGFIGAFTTFSTFALENVNLFRDGAIKLALINVLLSNVLGILFVFTGMFLARLLFSK